MDDIEKVKTLQENIYKNSVILLVIIIFFIFIHTNYGGSLFTDSLSYGVIPVLFGVGLLVLGGLNGLINNSIKGIKLCKKEQDFTGKTRLQNTSLFGVIFSVSLIILVFVFILVKSIWRL